MNMESSGSRMAKFPTGGGGFFNSYFFKYLIITKEKFIGGLKMENSLRDTDRMPFGKYKGKMLIEIPDEYLLWLYGEMGKKNVSPFARPLYDYLESNIEAIKKNIDDNKPFFND